MANGADTGEQAGGGGPLQQRYEGGAPPTKYAPTTVTECYGNGWRQLWKNFAMLLLIFVITVGVSIPQIIPLLGFLYGILVGWPLAYGGYFVGLKAARGEELKVGDLFEGFKNYGNALLATFLTGLICVIGFILLIVPGIIFACKLAFVPYLVTDRKMGAIDAIKESWRMTTGYSWRVFFIYLLAIPIAIAGVICLIVGVIPAMMWIGISFASLYHAAVRWQEEHPAPKQ